MQKPEGPACQSCGMPLSKDACGGGTESDGRTSREYCSHCYRAGTFLEPSLTADQMISRVRGRLQQIKLPPAAVDGFVREIPALRRWRG